MRLFFICVLCTGMMVTRVAAHEFWIDPQKYQVESGETLVADLRNGQKFKGVSLGYFERTFTRFDTVGADGVHPVPGRTGDVPALHVAAEDEGLLLLVHQTTPSKLTYKEWDKFQAFAEHKDFPDIRARHMARGLPDAGFKERYIRLAKSLVAVGDGAGSDHAVGLETEFVALSNPYTAARDHIEVQLFYQDAPRADAQVEMFERAPDGTVAVTLHRTDTAGRVTLPVRPGHTYLLDAVVLRDWAPEKDGDPVWETLWASLTFAVP